MARELAALLETTVETEYNNLLKLTEEAASRVPKPGAWSPKQELGHLIDSAMNNHVRFVRAALENESRSPSYAQDNWVALHGYSEMEWRDIVVLWLQHNGWLTHLVERIPEHRLASGCFVAEREVTLEFLIGDYIVHIRHHIDHLLSRDVVTPYPAPVLAV